jgi:hypothetical protein
MSLKNDVDSMQRRSQETLTIVIEEHNGVTACFVIEIPGNAISAVSDSKKEALLRVLDGLRSYVDLLPPTPPRNGGLHA